MPKHNLEKDKVPPVDILNLSHRHQDHFDVRTLAYLVRNARIITPDTIILAPNDQILLDVLEELEFKNVRVVADFEPIKVKDVTFTPTASLNMSSASKDYYPEHGFIVEDDEVKIWNQVDTIVSPDIIQYMKDQYGQLDMVHSRFVPLI